jgi:hypothetical protein
MSVEAISWALNLAPVPADRGGQPSSACKFVLVGLAHHAGPDGTGAFPSVATLVRYTGLSERTVRTCLDRLEAEGIIQPCDPDIVAARIKRADRRPKGWDLDLSRVRGDLTEAGIAALEHQFPGLAAMVTAIVRSDAGGAPDEVQSPHPVGAVDNWADQVRPLHPASGTGCNERTDGVQRAQPRGATVAPEPSREPSLEPPAATVRAREAARVGDVTAGGEPGLRVLRRPGQPLATHPHPAAQTHSGHHGCPGRGLDAPAVPRPLTIRPPSRHWPNRSSPSGPLPGAPPAADDHLFSFGLQRCLLTRTAGHGDPSPQHTIWHQAST